MPVKVVTSDNELRGRILFVLRNRADAAFRRARSQIELKAKIAFAKNIRESPTISSLLNGKLKADFGLDDEMSTKAVNELISYVSNNVNVVFNIGRDKQSVASISLTIPPVDTSAFLTAISGSYQSVGGYGGGQVNWLQWLLTKGTTVVIDGFSVEYGPFENSRSGAALMVEGGAFRVDPEFAGVEGDNFITRAINQSLNELRTILRDELQRSLR